MAYRSAISSRASTGRRGPFSMAAIVTVSAFESLSSLREPRNPCCSQRRQRSAPLRRADNHCASAASPVHCPPKAKEALTAIRRNYAFPFE